MLLHDRRLSVMIGPKVFITPLTTDGHNYIYLQVAGFLILWGTKKLDSKKKQCRKLYRLRFASAFVPKLWRTRGATGLRSKRPTLPCCRLWRPFRAHRVETLDPGLKPRAKFYCSFRARKTAHGRQSGPPNQVPSGILLELRYFFHQARSSSRLGHGPLKAGARCRF
jgi:hypothetical protein